MPEGVYNVNIDGQAATTWEIFPICVPTVGDLREPLLLPVACTLKVTPDQSGWRARRKWSAVSGNSSTTNPTVVPVPTAARPLNTTIYRFDPYTGSAP